MGKQADGIDWGRIPPERRGRWGRFLYRQRWSHGRQTQDAVRESLGRIGHPLSEAYYSDFETGKAIPSPDWQDVFRRLWDAEPEPDLGPAPQPAASGDLSALIAAIDRNTAALTAAIERVADPAVLTEVVVRTMLATLRASGALASSEERSGSGALPR